MSDVSLEFVAQQLELAEQLRAGRDAMFEPQDLPGRFGRVVQAIDHVLQAIDSPGVVGGGWAVWRHGFVARVTQDIDIVLPADRLDEFLRVAGVSGFEVLATRPGRWPKLDHKETHLQVDILPEGERPGTTSQPAPTTIRHPAQMGGDGNVLRFADLAALVELKLAAGRLRDEFDVSELIRANTDQVESIRRHLATIHPDYVERFDRLVERARQQDEP
jgi:hypothetical protein